VVKENSERRVQIDYCGGYSREKKRIFRRGDFKEREIKGQDTKKRTREKGKRRIKYKDVTSISREKKPLLERQGARLGCTDELGGRGESEKQEGERRVLLARSIKTPT